MRFAIFGDIHANLEALETVLADARENGCTHYVCLGDVVGYNANPHECLEIVRSLECPVVKGNHDEQHDKLVRSGLAHLFSEVEVLPEKHADAYNALATRHGCEAASTWMIGNSPRSDINPALAAGLHAIFIPHDFTWVLEHETIDQPRQGQTLLELGSFADLARHF